MALRKTIAPPSSNVSPLYGGYLEGYKFTVVTDYQSLRWLQRLEAPSGRLARWLFELQQYDYEVRYRRGAANKVADALSRQPEICALRQNICVWYQDLRARIRRDPAAHPDYMLRQGKIMRHLLHELDFREVPPEDQWKECVPQPERDDLIRRHHDEPTTGHLGIVKTISRIAQSYYWPGMFRNIARYVRTCDHCMAYKPQH